MKICTIIPTSKRTGSLRKALVALAAQTKPAERIVVVDACQDDATTRLCEEVRATKIPQLLHIPASRRSLTAQRNEGLLYRGDCDVVLFLDDDMDLAPDALAVLRDAWDCTDEDVVGIGGVFDDPRRHSRRRRCAGLFRLIRTQLGKLFLQFRSGDGRMQKSGMPTSLDIGRTSLSSGLVDVAFLPGGLMSFRAFIFERVGFDDYFDGYVLGEDYDFCSRAQVEGRLQICPLCQGIHRLAAQDRSKTNIIVRQSIMYHFIWFRKNKDITGATWPAYLWSVLGEVFFAIMNHRWPGLIGSIQGIHGISRLARGRKPPRNLSMEKLAWEE